MPTEWSFYTLNLRFGDASLTLRADTKDDLVTLTEQANEFLKTVGPTSAPGTATGEQHDQGGAGGSTTSAAGVTDTSKDSSGDMPTPPVNAVQQMVDETKARQAEADAKIAQEKVSTHLGPGEELAPSPLLKAAAKKKGVSIEELGPISTNRAKDILKGGE